MMQVFDNQGNLKQKSLVTSGVNSVTATPPLFSTGGSAPDISIALATALSDGYLSSVDWSTFNNKQNALTLTTIGSSGAATLIGATLNIPQYTDQYLGTVTSVGLSAGTGISIGGTNPVTSSGTISVTNTAPDQIVALTAGTGIGVSGTYPNFTITNSAPSPAGAITGTGTTNYVPKFTSSSAIGNSQIFDNGTSVGIATATPSAAYRLDIEGNVRVRSGQILAFSNFDNTNTYQLYNIGGSGAGGETLVFTNGTTERMRLDASGRLGINETSITSMLQVKDVGGGNLFKFTSGTVILESYVSGGIPSLGTTSNTDFRFRTNDTERMRITSGGNVGIGTTSPSVKLQVVGDGLFNSNTNTNLTINSNGGIATLTLTNGAGSQAIYGGVGGSNNMDFYTNSTYRMRLDASGNLLVGGTSVYGATITSYGSATRSGGLGIRNSAGTAAGFFGTYAAGSGSGSTDISVESAGFMQFTTGGSERMRITSGGNVGIGTTSPLYLFHAISSSTTIAGFRNSGAANAQILIGNTVSDLQLRTLASGDALIFSDVSKYLAFGTNGATERMRITSDGELLINTTSDVGDFKLQVSGNAYVSGSVGIGSTSLTGYNLIIQRNLTGAATGVFSIYQNSSIQSDVTGTANGIGSFTGISGTTALGTLRHFVAAQGTFAAGGTVTTQIGYSAASTLTGATNNYGFYGDIASGTGRWNLYMAGTANNYMNGNLGIGVTTPTEKLEVNGAIKTAAPSGGTAAAWKLGSKVAATVSLVTTDYIEVEIGGVAYKLGIVN